MAVWSMEAVSEFINLLREHPCLWKVRSRDYTARHKRNMAYDELVKYCRTIGFPSANREFVTKKIQNLRGAFRKELKKVLEARRQNVVYQPSLWYYEQMMFIRDQDANTSNATDDDYIEADVEILQESDYNAEYSSDYKEQFKTPQPTRTPLKSEKVTVEVSPARSFKRKFRSSVVDNQYIFQKRFMSACTEALKNKKELSEYEALSVTFAKKLEKMHATQALYAEAIIHSVLRKGLLNQLTEMTDVCDKQCNKVLSSSQNPSSSVERRAPKMESVVDDDDDDDPLI
ncbi:uncharacterized protein LOC121733669 [Aricia agestis]|uniref:uncharacterized protein LOC121733669 n=1 Tax=Aricia agestis TaxID=91739 RepID=UPI001C20997A|nr:uncharacterized protein LOC121733669 [Aricia agestis]